MVSEERTLDEIFCKFHPSQSSLTTAVVLCDFTNFQKAGRYCTRAECHQQKSL